MRHGTIQSQISFFDRIPPVCRWEYSHDADRTTQTQGRLTCGRCGHFLGYTGMYSWRLSKEEAEQESKDVWCAQLGVGGYCYECGAYAEGTGVRNYGIKDYYHHVRDGIHYMPFSDEQLLLLDEAARSRQCIELLAIAKAKSGITYRFKVEIGSFWTPTKEDLEYYVNLWEDPSLIVHKEVSYTEPRNKTFIGSYGSGEKFGELKKLGSREFVAKIFNVTMQGKSK